MHNLFIKRGDKLLFFPGHKINHSLEFGNQRATLPVVVVGKPLFFAILSIPNYKKI
jgi:hypothetical protein